ncbi:unnamed protein product [Urochloa decumbens]|uniref:Uncharacterized protein n=1 Tax=Urochloa decumbens TaxID=240449 RepID=A0ABC9DXC4_9POAL
MADNRNRCNTWVTNAGFSLLTVNSGLAIYRAKGDLASILFVSGSYITLLLLFAGLRAYERAPPGSPARERARRAVAAVMPSAVAGAVVWALAAATPTGGFFAFFLTVTVCYVALVLLFACLRAYERAPARERAAALMMAAFGAMACDAALAIHDVLGDLGSAMFVLVAYVGFLVLIFRFLRAFAGRARGVGHGQDQA